MQAGRRRARTHEPPCQVTSFRKGCAARQAHRAAEAPRRPAVRRKLSLAPNGVARITVCAGKKTKPPPQMRDNKQRVPQSQRHAPTHRRNAYGAPAAKETRHASPNATLRARGDGALAFRQSSSHATARGTERSDAPVCTPRKDHEITLGGGARASRAIAWKHESTQHAGHVRAARARRSRTGVLAPTRKGR